MEDKASKQQAKEKLISEIYEVALQPELYGDFIDLWEKQLASAVSRLEEIGRNRSSDVLVQDPEIERHFERAYQILEKMGRGDNFEDSPREFVESKPNASILLGDDGNIVAANKHSIALFGELKSVRQLRSYLQSEDGDMLEQFLLRLDRLQINPEIQLMRMQLPQRGSNQIAEQWFIARPMRLSTNLAPMLYVSALTVNWTKSLQSLLQNTFSLTQSEVEIVRDLAAGKTLNEVAQLRDRSLHTVRAQVKSIFPKMSANSQSELVRIVSTLAAYATETPGITAVSRQKLVSGERKDILVKDGRIIPVNCFGPSDGRPVLFIHGMLDSFIFNKELGDSFGKNGIRLIAPSRPGFGESPMAHSTNTMPTDFADDLEYILDAFEIPSCPIIGHMAGSVYAFAAALKLKDRIERIINVAGGVPIVSTKQFSAMSRRQRAIAWTARFTPRLLPTVLRAGISQIDSGGHEAFMNALYPAKNADRKTSENAEIAASIQEGYKFAVAQGHRAFEIDSRHVTRDWSEYVTELTIPVTLIHGDEDPVVSIESVRAFANKYENISLSEFENCGQLILYQQNQAVLDQLTGFNR